MGKMFNCLIMGLGISIAMTLLNATGIHVTSLFTFLLNPTDWQHSAFFGLFLSITTIIGVIVIGISAIIKQDWVFRAGMIISLSSVVVGPFIDFWTFLNAQLSYVGTNCTLAPVCITLNAVGGVGQYIAMAIAGPLILYAIWACIEWIFTGDKF